METQMVEERQATDVRKFMQEYFAAWTESVPDKILAYFSDDVVIGLMGVPAMLDGKAAVKEGFVVPFASGFPGNVHQMRNMVHEGESVVIEWLFVAVHTGNFAGIPATGRTVNLPGCSVYTVKGRKITRGVLYYNGPTLLEQLGVTP